MTYHTIRTEKKNAKKIQKQEEGCNFFEEKKTCVGNMVLASTGRNVECDVNDLSRPACRGVVLARDVRNNRANDVEGAAPPLPPP